MLFLLMQIDGARYALDIAVVIEVLPLVTLHPAPRAPPGIAGLVDYGGTPVSVVDLSVVLANRPAQRRFNTRLVMINHTAGGKTHPLGLIAEHATQTMRCALSDFQDSGVTSAPDSGTWRVALDPAGAVHLMDVSRLMPRGFSDSLEPRAVGT